MALAQISASCVSLQINHRRVGRIPGDTNVQCFHFLDSELLLTLIDVVKS